MAIDLYTATTNPGGSTSGWEARFCGHFQDASKHQWRVEIIDQKLTSSGFNWNLDAPVDFTLGADGFTLSHEGSPDNLHQSFIPSNCTIDFHVATEQHERLFTQLNSSNSDDHRFGIVIYKFVATSNESNENTPIGVFSMQWCGVINPEGTTLEVTGGVKFLRVTAHDGLSLLNSVEYLQPDGSLWTDTPRLSHLISRCLKNIPTSSLWGYGFIESPAEIPSSDSLVQHANEFFNETIHYYDTDNHKVFNTLALFKSTLYHTKVSSLTFYNTERKSDRFEGEVLNTDTVSCSEVLNSICQVFRARLFMNHGSWIFENPKALQNLSAPNYHRWTTQNDMSGEPIDIYAIAKTSQTVKFHVEDSYEDQSQLLSGAEESFLHPVKSTHSTHVKGGTQNLFDPLGSLMYTNIGATHIHTIANEDGTFSPFSTRTNPDFVFSAGDTPSIIGQARAFLNPDHNSVGGGSSSDLLHIGGHVIIDVEIKVGAYYLKGNTTFATQTQNIQRTAASDLTHKSVLRDGVVEWTTVQSTYSIPCPNALSDPQPMIATHEGDDTEYIGGFHLAMNGDENDEFRYSSGFMGSGGTEHDISKFDIAWTLPPLPAGTHTGATVKFSVRAFTCEGVAITNSTDLNNLRKQSTSGLVQLYNFRMLTGVDGSEIDAVFSNVQDVSTQRLDVCSSLLGDQLNGAALGSLMVEDVDSLGSWTYSNSKWGSSKNLDANKSIHELNAIEGLQERGRSLKIRRGTIKSYENNFDSYKITQKALPTFQTTLIFDDETGDPVFIPLSFTHTAAPSIFDFVGYLDGVSPTITSDESNNKGDRGLLDNPPKPGLDFDSDVNGKNINGASVGTIAKLNIVRNNINSNSTGINTLTVNATGSSTPAVNLGEIHDVLAQNVTSSANYGNSLAWFEMGSSVVGANRGTQSGKNIVMIDDAGQMQETIPPPSTKYLQSTSTGVIKWQLPTFILSTLSGRASMYYAGRYYYGSVYYGFNFYNVQTNATVMTSLNDQYANNGIVFPFSGTIIKIHALIRNDSAQDDVSIYLHTGARPGGTSTNITLTEIGNVTAGCSAGQDLYYNADGTFTYAFNEGDLLFISYKRAGSNGTQYVNFSHTISIQ